MSSKRIEENREISERISTNTANSTIASVSAASASTNSAPSRQQVQKDKIRCGNVKSVKKNDRVNKPLTNDLNLNEEEDEEDDDDNDDDDFTNRDAVFFSDEEEEYYSETVDKSDENEEIRNIENNDDDNSNDHNTSDENTDNENEGNNDAQSSHIVKNLICIDDNPNTTESYPRNNRSGVRKSVKTSPSINTSGNIVDKLNVTPAQPVRNKFQRKDQIESNIRNDARHKVSIDKNDEPNRERSVSPSSTSNSSDNDEEEDNGGGLVLPTWEDTDRQHSASPVSERNARFCSERVIERSSDLLHTNRKRVRYTGNNDCPSDDDEYSRYLAKKKTPRKSYYTTRQGDTAVKHDPRDRFITQQGSLSRNTIPVATPTAGSTRVGKQRSDSRLTSYSTANVIENAVDQRKTPLQKRAFAVTPKLLCQTAETTERDAKITSDNVLATDSSPNGVKDKRHVTKDNDKYRNARQKHFTEAEERHIGRDNSMRNLADSARNVRGRAKEETRLRSAGVNKVNDIVSSEKIYSRDVANKTNVESNIDAANGRKLVDNYDGKKIQPIKRTTVRKCNDTNTDIAHRDKSVSKELEPQYESPTSSYTPGVAKFRNRNYEMTEEEEREIHYINSKKKSRNMRDHASPVSTERVVSKTVVANATTIDRDTRTNKADTSADSVNVANAKSPVDKKNIDWKTTVVSRSPRISFTKAQNRSLSNQLALRRFSEIEGYILPRTTSIVLCDKVGCKFFVVHSCEQNVIEKITDKLQRKESRFSALENATAPFVQSKRRSLCVTKEKFSCKHCTFAFVHRKCIYDIPKSRQTKGADNCQFIHVMRSCRCGLWFMYQSSGVLRNRVIGDCNDRCDYDVEKRECICGCIAIDHICQRTNPVIKKFRSSKTATVPSREANNSVSETDIDEPVVKD